MDTEFNTKLNALSDKYPNLFPECKYGIVYIGAGWLSILEQMSEELSQFPDVSYIQVKEKFGQLRVYCSYTSTTPLEIRPIIDKYELMARTTCETCGAEGSIKSKGGWLKCSCEKH